MVSLDDKLRPHLQANLTHRRFKRVSPGDRRAQPERSRHETDAFMPHRGEVLSRLAEALRVIDADIADARCLRPDVHENERQIPKSKMFEKFVFHSECKD